MRIPLIGKEGGVPPILHIYFDRIGFYYCTRNMKRFYWRRKRVGL